MKLKKVSVSDELSYFQEHFLVPDHTIKDINGASFAGFYYICFQKSTATIEGYYYHRSSEWYVFVFKTWAEKKYMYTFWFKCKAVGVVWNSLIERETC